MAEEWQFYFEELNSFVLLAGRQRGIVDPQYTDFVIERLVFACGTCTTIKMAMETPHVPLDDTEVGLCTILEQLFGHMKTLFHATQWRIFIHTTTGSIHKFRNNCPRGENLDFHWIQEQPQ